MNAAEAQTHALFGKVCVVTGGASGIGRATSAALAGAGAHVVVADISGARVDSTAAELSALSNSRDVHLGLAVDVRDERAVEGMVERALERFGRIDALVACAAVLRGSGSTPKPVYKIDSDEWDQVLDTNLKGTFLTNRAVIPAMMKQRAGDIVNLSSVSGRQGRAHDGPYCASKFGVIGLSEALAEEARPFGIRVQIVIPDAVKTPMWDQNGPVPCPPDALEPERVADLIVHMITLPRDTTLGAVTIAPFKARRRRKEPTGIDASGTRDRA